MHIHVGKRSASQIHKWLTCLMVVQTNNTKIANDIMVLVCLGPRNYIQWSSYMSDQSTAYKSLKEAIR